MFIQAFIMDIIFESILKGVIFWRECFWRELKFLKGTVIGLYGIESSGSYLNKYVHTYYAKLSRLVFFITERNIHIGS